MAVDYSSDITPWSGQSSVAGGAGIRRRLRGSRTAVIALTDNLARHSMPALIMIFAASFGLAAFHLFTATGLAEILRTALWLTLVLAPVWVTALRLRRFRSGIMLTGRPLTWRTGHVAGLLLISTALGCGALMLTTGAGDGTSAITLITLTLLLTAFGLGHLAHAQAALAAALPGLILTTLAVLIAGPGLVATSLIAACISAGALWGYVRHRAIVVQALEHHPRQHSTAIKARQKKKSSAYNPFKKQPGDAGREPRRPWLYNPSEL